MYFKVEDKILLRLYKDYFISHTINIKIDKLDQRYIDLFDVINKINK